MTLNAEFLAKLKARGGRRVNVILETRELEKLEKIRQGYFDGGLKVSLASIIRMCINRLEE